MNRWLLTAALGASLASLGSIANADAPTSFSDDACPQANPAGRQLNSLNASGKATNDQMIAASQGLVDAYKDCASSFDHDVNMKNNDAGSSDYIIVHRAYARLQLARAYQRLGSLDEQLQRFGKARIEYDAALGPISELEGVIGNSDPTSSGSEGKLLAEGRKLRAAIEATEAKLPLAQATPAPAPSGT